MAKTVEIVTHSLFFDCSQANACDVIQDVRGSQDRVDPTTTAYSLLETEYLFKEIDSELTLVTSCYFLGFSPDRDPEFREHWSKAVKENIKEELNLFKQAAEQRHAQMRA
jgi:hypothetical protein